MGMNDLLEEALQLSPASRAHLVEKIVESIAADIDPDVQQAHLGEIQRRRRQTASGQDTIVSGEEALARVRIILQK
jgi:putative addiction module component (TIGR02574 family)